MLSRIFYRKCDLGGDRFLYPSWVNLLLDRQLCFSDSPSLPVNHGSTQVVFLSSNLWQRGFFRRLEDLICRQRVLFRRPWWLLSDKLRRQLMLGHSPDLPINRKGGGRYPFIRTSNILPSLIYHLNLTNPLSITFDMSSNKSDKALWRSLQNLKIGSDLEPWSVHIDTQEKFVKEHKLCLVVMGVNRDHQHPIGIRDTMPRAWNLRGKVEGQVNDDGTVNFYFQNEHLMVSVLENQPYSFKGWMVTVEKWCRSTWPNYLHIIPFWILIERVPNQYRRPGYARSIGSNFGHVVEPLVIQPTRYKPGELWAKVEFHIDTKISLARKVTLVRGEEPVQLQFKFMGLIKFCTTCGSLRHDAQVCPQMSEQDGFAKRLMELGEHPQDIANFQLLQDQVKQQEQNLRDLKGKGILQVEEDSSSQFMQEEMAARLYTNDVRGIFIQEPMAEDEHRESMKRKAEEDLIKDSNGSIKQSKLKGRADTPKPPSPG